MSINYQNFRNLMVENQLRPNKIQNTEILDLFNKIPKELFIPEDTKSISYSDLDICIKNNRGYLKNLHLAQLIHYSEIKKDFKILHIGALTGYVSVLLSSLCKKLIVIEEDKELFEILKQNIRDLNIKNIQMVNGLLEDGFAKLAPYDLIFIDNPIKKINNLLKEQISNNSGILIMVKKYDNHISKAYKIIKNNNLSSKEYLFDVFSNFELYKEKEEFIF